MSDKPITPVVSPAARHIAWKIGQSIRAGMTFDAFGRERIQVILDLGAAKEFVEEVELGTNLAAEGGKDA
jgi:hypothetical protein